ncbi:lipid phosphate phosphatase 2 [Vitis vinifera]|uniref:Phosphatidic acid phosphatase type 2/haloperoxidase domain-containing protein n=1 Tax=Vitis vinifera TaxID=29760 RepID=D7T8Z3_VITVI|eukprot:XP_002282854.1 PREDICTED: lipid phosphate phosphatase 2 [Vitis vinifera]
MPEIQLGAHTIRSHGLKVARSHMHDWLILILLVVIEVILNVIEPFHRFVGKEMLTDLSYPLQTNTIPFWSVPLIAILLPIVVILVYYFIRQDVYDLHHAILGLLFSVLITAVITDAIKDAVGRPRPDFFWRCFPNGKGVFDTRTTDVLCTGDKSVIKEGHKSFPSGHTSWSFAGLSFLSWYLSGKIRAFDRKGHVAKLCIVFLPILLAALVGVSRVDDYWHHWQDVFAGGVIGATVASFCYLQFFPPPYDIDGWGPHAYFEMLAESRNGIQSSTTGINHLSMGVTELQSIHVESHLGMDTSVVYTRDTSPILDGLNSGRRN